MTKLNAALEARLRFIDFCLAFYSSINREHVKDYFGVSTPQASLDFAVYMKQAPNNMFYDSSKKLYRRTPSFERRFP